MVINTQPASPVAKKQMPWRQFWRAFWSTFWYKKADASSHRLNKMNGKSSFCAPFRSTFGFKMWSMFSETRVVKSSFSDGDWLSPLPIFSLCIFFKKYLSDLDISEATRHVPWVVVVLIFWLPIGHETDPDTVNPPENRHADRTRRAAFDFDV